MQQIVNDTFEKNCYAPTCSHSISSLRTNTHILNPLTTINSAINFKHSQFINTGKVGSIKGSKNFKGHCDRVQFPESITNSLSSSNRCFIMSFRQLLACAQSHRTYSYTTIPWTPWVISRRSLLRTNPPPSVIQILRRPPPIKLTLRK